MLNPEISIIVPVFNEEDNVGILAENTLRVMRSLGKGFEIIFVNDGSTELTKNRLEQLSQQNPEIKVLHLKRNVGQSRALEQGLKIASAKTIVTMDGDLQNDPVDIPHILAALKDSDMVTGIRKKRKDSLIKLCSARVAYLVRNAVLQDGIIDIGCGLKAFRKSCLEGIEWFNGVHRFLPALVKFKGLRVVQVEVSHRARKFGKSKYNVRKRLFQGLKDLIYVSGLKRQMGKERQI